MKKLFKLLFLFLVFFTCINSANAVSNDEKIQFIYINGSNLNDEQAKESYIKGVHNLHKEMKKVLENDEFIYQKLLNNGRYSINDNEDIMFWGFGSLQELDIIKNNLAETKKSSPLIAQGIRNLLAHFMHDAIWVQRKNNMQKIINQLNKHVLDAHSRGEKVILAGHSAGSFVTYEYMFNKIQAVNLDYFTGVNDNKYTCADAFIQSGMGFQLATGRIIKNPNNKEFKTAYNNIDKYTNLVCAPNDTIVGVINFGSPLSLFYSSQVSHAKESSDIYRLYFLKYLLENNIFFLTVNFADDPLGFPVGRNISKSDIEMELNTTFPQDGKGFVYNYSQVRSSGTFASAHSGYWKHPKRFAKTVKDAYKKGYNNFYSQY